MNDADKEKIIKIVKNKFIDIPKYTFDNTIHEAIALTEKAMKKEFADLIRSIDDASTMLKILEEQKVNDTTGGENDS